MSCRIAAFVTILDSPCNIVIQNKSTAVLLAHYFGMGFHITIVLGYYGQTMPSWNIHTAHVERLLDRQDSVELGIGDVNAFLFGNYVPDIYIGFMVPDVSFHIDYCMTHLAKVNTIPVPDADLFWNNYIRRRRPATATGASLALGAWAHLVADAAYNGRFRAFCETHDVPGGEERREGKQGDFALFGKSLAISSLVRQTPELMEATRAFVPYNIVSSDVEKSIRVANAIVEANSHPILDGSYRLLSAEWMSASFDECDAELKTWLAAWQVLERKGHDPSASAIRAEAGLPPRMFG